MKPVFCEKMELKYSLIGSVMVSSKGRSTILSGQLLQDGGKHGETSGLCECGPTVTILWL